ARHALVRTEADADDLGPLGAITGAVRHAGPVNKHVSGGELLIGKTFQRARHTWASHLPARAIVGFLSRVFNITANAPRSRTADEQVNFGNIAVVKTSNGLPGRPWRRRFGIESIHAEIEFAGIHHANRRVIGNSLFLDRLLHLLDSDF